MREQAVEDEKKKLKEEKTNFKREVLVSLGYDAEKAKKINSLEVLDAFIEDLKERQNVTPPVPQPMTLKAGVPSVIAPGGEQIKLNVEEDPVNKLMKLAHINDPFAVPRRINKGSKDARIAFLPPDDDHPYPRVIG